MPPVRRDGTLYVDSVWIKDANPGEAVRRRCDELWLVWCIGNSNAYRPGFLNEYVHMIELSANGGLFEELGHLQREAAGQLPRLHVIKPEYPLPLDPDFYFGRIDADALVAMGYRDAKTYLARRSEQGVAWDPAATRMRDQPRGVAFSKRLRGSVDGSRVELRVRSDVRDLERFDDRHGAELVGVLDHERLGRGLLARGGSFWLDGRRQVYEVVFDLAGEEVRLEVRGGTARLATNKTGSIRLGLRERLRFLSTIQPSGTDSVAARLRATWRLMRLLRSGRR